MLTIFPTGHITGDAKPTLANEIANMNRDEAIKRIRAGLKARSGKVWSVTGGTGTAWGWIKIDVPPAKRTAHYLKLEGKSGDYPENYQRTRVDTGEPGGYMTEEAAKELQALLGLTASVHCQGENIPASTAHYIEYVDRAEGRMPSVIGQQYWD